MCTHAKPMLNANGKHEYLYTPCCLWCGAGTVFRIAHSPIFGSGRADKAPSWEANPPGQPIVKHWDAEKLATRCSKRQNGRARVLEAGWPRTAGASAPPGPCHWVVGRQASTGRSPPGTFRRGGPGEPPAPPGSVAGSIAYCCCGVAGAPYSPHVKVLLMNHTELRAIRAERLWTFFSRYMAICSDLVCFKNAAQKNSSGPIML